MKKVVLLFLFFCFFKVNAINVVPISIENIVVDGFNFKVEYNYETLDAKATLESGDYSGDLVIPDGFECTINGDPLHVSSIVIADKAFLNCTGITSISIPNSVLSIGESAFSGCSGLSSISIQNGISSIGVYAFLGCGSLTSILIPASVTSIGFQAFAGCYSLESINVEEGNPTFHAPNNCNAIIDKSSNSLILGCKNTVIPDGVASIGLSAFNGCKELISISIPNSVKKIGQFAFQGCDGLKDVYYFAENVVDRNIKDDICCLGAILYVYDYLIEDFKTMNLGFKAIEPIEKITEFTLTYYADGAEYKTVQNKYDDEISPIEAPVKDGYTFVEWKDLPTKMPGKNITTEAVYSKNEVKDGSVVYWARNENAVVIGNEDATGEIEILSSIEFDVNELPVTEIDDNAFKNCANITKVNIPATVTKIGERTFANIDKLTDFTIYADDVPETDRTAFENSYIEDYVTLHVPYNSLEKYKAVAPWKNFKEVVAIAGTQKLPDPIIKRVNNEFQFTCDEEGVEYHYVLTPIGDNKGVGNKVSIYQVYDISVYATKEGFADSDTVKRTFTFRRGDVNGDGDVNVADHVELTNIIMDLNKVIDLDDPVEVIDDDGDF